MKESQLKNQGSILASAKTLFWKHGIKKVTVEEISKNAGISKMTLYRLYKNKSEIVRDVIKEVQEEGITAYRRINQSNISFPAKVQQIIALKYEQTQLMSDEFLTDLYRMDEPVITTYLKETSEIYKNEYINDLKEAQKKGWIRKDVNFDFLLFSMNNVQELLQREDFLSLFNSKQEAIMQLTNQFFYGILPQDQP